MRGDRQERRAVRLNADNAVLTAAVADGRDSLARMLPAIKLYFQRRGVLF